MKLIKGLFRFIIVIIVICAVIIVAANFTTFNTFNAGDFVIPGINQSPNDLGVADQSIWSVMMTVYKLTNSGEGSKEVVQSDAPTEQSYDNVQAKLGEAAPAEGGSGEPGGEQAPAETFTYSSLLDGPVTFEEEQELEFSNSDIAALLNLVLNSGDGALQLSKNDVSASPVKLLSAPCAKVTRLDASQNMIKSLFSTANGYVESISLYEQDGTKMLKSVISLTLPQDAIDELKKNEQIPAFLTNILSSKFYCTLVTAVDVENNAIVLLQHSANYASVNGIPKDNMALVSAIMENYVGISTDGIEIAFNDCVATTLNNLGRIDASTFGNGGLTLTTRKA